MKRYARACAWTVPTRSWLTSCRICAISGAREPVGRGEVCNTAGKGITVMSDALGAAPRCAFALHLGDLALRVGRANTPSQIMFATASIPAPISTTIRESLSMPVSLSVSTLPRYLTRMLHSVALAALLASPAAQADPAALYARLLPVAERGNPAAQYHVGMMLNNGIGTTKEPKQAFAWLEKGAAAGDLLASYKLGCYYAGQFVDVVALDPAKSFEHKMAAANGGYSLAQVDVGLAFHRRGKFDEAIFWWTKAAGQGEPLALFNLARLYMLGTDVAPDRIKAYAYFKLAKMRSRQGTNARAEATFTEMKAKMSAAELDAAEQTVSAWKAHPSALTLRAASNVDEAKELVVED